MNAPALCIKYNNAATNDPCALCGARTDPQVGLEVFVEGTWSLVCDGCTERLAPELAEAMREARAREN